MDVATSAVVVGAAVVGGVVVAVGAAVVGDVVVVLGAAVVGGVVVVVGAAVVGGVVVVVGAAVMVGAIAVDWQTASLVQVACSTLKVVPTGHWKWKDMSSLAQKK